MLTLQRIERDIEKGRFDPLLGALVANGLPLPLPLQVRLSQSPAAVTGLGLIRVLELTHGPTPQALRLRDKVVAGIGEDGSVGEDPLATGIALAALRRLQRQLPDRAGEMADQAVERLTEALSGMQGGEGLFAGLADRTAQDRALASAMILLLLGDDVRFSGAVRFFDLVAWFDDHQKDLDRDTARLWRLAQSTMHDTSALEAEQQLVAA